MKDVKTWGRQDRIRKVYVRVREWRVEVRSGKERTRVRVTAAVVGNPRSKTRDLDRYEERDTQNSCVASYNNCRRTWEHTEVSRALLYKVVEERGGRSIMLMSRDLTP
jgi:hypothetical protein